jgi:thiamine-phosphate pyrophosphorylase
MRARHPALPHLWLMTDPRMGDALWAALERLPRGAGVVVRHYGLPLAERRALFARIERIARRRRLIVLRGGDQSLGRGEAGVHGRNRHKVRGVKSWPAHDRRELIAGIRAGADILFLSPINPTRSHPDTPPLGKIRAMLAKQGIGRPVIALGGMGSGQARWLESAKFHGWAAIDAWTTPSR